MKFGEKLRKLIGDREQAEVAKAAGITPSGLSSYLTGKALPGAAAAIKLARSLECDLLWLLDESRDWDDRHSRHSLKTVPDDLLIVEIRDRYIDAALKLRSSLLDLERIDWIRAASTIRERTDGKLSHEAASAASTYYQAEMQWRRVYSFNTSRDSSHLDPMVQLPLGVTYKDLSLESLQDLERSLSIRLKGFTTFMELLGKQLAGEPSRFAGENLPRHRWGAKVIKKRRRGG